MTRTLALVGVLMGAAGFALGWLAFDERTPRPPLKPPSAASAADASSAAVRPSASLVDVAHQYALRPEDVHADRETPAVAADGAGHVVLAWASQTGALERTIFLARSSDGGAHFEAPIAWRKVPIYRFHSGSPARPMTFSTHVLPRLAAGRDAIWLAWVEAIDGGPEVRYLAARSTDGGAHFSEPAPVHGSNALRPGFTALGLAADGAVLAAWLDGRSKHQQPYFAASPGGSAAGRFGAERLVFAGPGGQGVCPCCDLAVARAQDGTDYVAFRNADAGHRDIVVARSSPDGFDPPVPVSPDHWTFDGCPHDGPALALAGDALHLLWMDGHAGTNRVYSAHSRLGSLKFAPRELSPGSKGSQAHPRLIADGKGRLLAVWDESLGAAEPAQSSSSAGPSHAHGAALSGDGRAVMYATADASGTFAEARPIAPRPGAFQLNPAVAVAPGGDVFVAWNELGEDGKQVVLVRLKRGASSK